MTMKTKRQYFALIPNDDTPHLISLLKTVLDSYKAARDKAQSDELRDFISAQIAEAELVLDDVRHAPFVSVATFSRDCSCETEPEPDPDPAEQFCGNARKDVW